MKTFFIFVLIFLKSSKVIKCQELCENIGCVHASATLLSRINPKINPCDDFYEFACGTFLKNVYTPDEKLIVNTESLLIDQLDESLYRILKKDVDETEPRPHRMAKLLYRNCMNLDKIKQVKTSQILCLISNLGGWPVLSSDWQEANWTWEKTILTFRRFLGVGNKMNIFRNNLPDGLDIHDDVDDAHVEQRITGNVDTLPKRSLEHEYPIFVYRVAINLGASDTQATRDELNDALMLGIALNQLLNGRKFKRTSRVRAAEQRELKIELDLMRWMELFERFKLKDIESAHVNHTVSVYDNLKQLKKKFSQRAFANYIMWRIVEFTTQFLDDDTLESSLKLFKETYGVVDREQRWKYCTRLTRKYAELAAGSMYIKDYFPRESKDVATVMVQNIIDEFRAAITSSDWMDDKTKNGALSSVNDLKVFIGYDERLLDVDNVISWYGEASRNFTNEFLYLALQLNAHATDKSFQHKFRNFTDWTVYARPTTSKASYNHRDNSIYFAAAFLQPPNFDKDRPMSMNFGAIGSIIAHELTHCFDRFSQKINEWTRASVDKYITRLKCIVDQYNNFVDPDLNVILNGSVTVTEDVADNGGIKLAYRAYEKWSKELTESKQRQLIAIDYTPQQLFWISYAQFYCSVQREELKRFLLAGREVHSFDRFRVIGPLANAFEFSRDFKCPITSKMNVNARHRCVIW